MFFLILYAIRHDMFVNRPILIAAMIELAVEGVALIGLSFLV
jgi:hypothetical protein